MNAVQRATRLIRRAGRTECELFGGTLDSVRVSRVLTDEDPLHTQQPASVRKLRAQVLLCLLGADADSIDAGVLDPLIRIAADVLQRVEPARSQLLRMQFERFSEPRPQPPVFTVPRTPRRPRRDENRRNAAATSGRTSGDRAEESPTVPEARATREGFTETRGLLSAPATEPEESSAGTTLVESADAFTGTEPVVPADPSTGTEPVVPTDPSTGAEPVVPTDPSTGAEPVVPTDPSTGAEPADICAEDLAIVRWEIGVPRSSSVRVTLHDATGHRVRVLFEGTLDAGVHHCEADVPTATLRAIGPLGYVRMELPGGRWQQGLFLPGDRSRSQK